MLPYREGRDEDDEKHVHPLQLDVINRVVVLRSNPGEIVLTPFMGVGSEVFAAVMNGRRGIGFELKESYYRQAIKNMEYVEQHKEETKEKTLFDGLVDNAIAQI
ncbi:MAG TPA: DNA methyltransferase [Spirochaetota bacterium]|nr:DNA methyltransferase [Spirochaetota bacterium]HQO00718.1 DNA methyltransferase [Spirochaetota bacterium]